MRSVSSRKVETDGKWGLQVMDHTKEGLPRAVIGVLSTPVTLTAFLCVL